MSLGLRTPAVNPEQEKIQLKLVSEQVILTHDSSVRAQTIHDDRPCFSPNANLGNQAATPCRMTFFPKPYWEMLLPVNLYQRENEGRGTKAHVSKK